MNLLQPDILQKVLRKLAFEKFGHYHTNDALTYALRISEVLPTLKKLETLASRYNTAHSGAGGAGLEAAKNSANYDAVKVYLQQEYLKKFADLSDAVIEKACGTADKRKTDTAKIQVWNKAKEQIVEAQTLIQYELPGLQHVVDGLTEHINSEITQLGGGR